MDCRRNDDMERIQLSGKIWSADIDEMMPRKINKQIHMDNLQSTM